MATYYYIHVILLIILSKTAKIVLLYCLISCIAQVASYYSQVENSLICVLFVVCPNFKFTVFKGTHAYSFYTKYEATLSLKIEIKEKYTF